MLGRLLFVLDLLVTLGGWDPQAEASLWLRQGHGLTQTRRPQQRLLPPAWQALSGHVAALGLCPPGLSRSGKGAMVEWEECRFQSQSQVQV